MPVTGLHFTLTAFSSLALTPRAASEANFTISALIQRSLSMYSCSHMGNVASSLFQRCVTLFTPSSAKGRTTSTHQTETSGLQVLLPFL